MTYRGTVRNGVVVFDEGASPPDGTVVEFQLPESDASRSGGNGARRRIFDINRYAGHTGISDLAAQHDHYLYGHPKVSDAE